MQGVLIANIAAIVVAIGTAIILALNNAGSKNLPLAAAALVGVLVGYGIQLPFELVKSTTRETLGVELTTDRSIPEIRQWAYKGNAMSRVGNEVQASRWLASTNRSLFDDASQRDRIAADLVVFSLLSFFAQYERDWQLQRTSYGTLELTQAVSKPEECTLCAEQDLRQILITSGNVFADAPLQVFTKVCLPPNTALRLTAGSTDTGAVGAAFKLEWRLLTLENPFCRVSFSVDHPAHNILNVHPFRRQYVPLENGESRYEMRTMGMALETTFFALRAQHRDAKRYRDWTYRVSAGLHEWFMPGDRTPEPRPIVVNPAPQ